MPGSLGDVGSWSGTGLRDVAAGLWGRRRSGGRPGRRRGSTCFDRVVRIDDDWRVGNAQMSAHRGRDRRRRQPLVDPREETAQLQAATLGTAHQHAAHDAAAGVAAHLEADQRGLRRGPHQEGCSAGGGINEAHHHVGRAHRAIGLHPRLRVHRDACSSRIARTSGIAAIARGADSGHRERGRQDQGDHAHEPHDDGPAAGRQDRLTRSTRDRHGPSNGRGLGGRTDESSDLRHLPAPAVHGDGRGRGGRTGESRDLRHLLALAVQGDARLREGGLDQLADRARRRYAELVPHGVAVAVELEQGTAEVAAAKMGADRQLTCPLQERIEAAGRARCVD